MFERLERQVLMEEIHEQKINIEAQNFDSIVAVLDFYGGKYYWDPAWHSPTPFFANALDYPHSLARQIFSEPPVSASCSAVRGHRPRPSLCDAWLSNAFKSGRHLSLVAKDRNYDRIDPSENILSQVSTHNVYPWNCRYCDAASFQ